MKGRQNRKTPELDTYQEVLKQPRGQKVKSHEEAFKRQNRPRFLTSYM